MRNFPSLVVAAFLTVFSAPNASAYLWETQAQIEERYGKPVKTTGYPYLRAYIYVSEGLEIRIRFFNGVSQEESYLPTAEGPAGSSFNIQPLLELNSLDGQWREQAENEWAIETRNGRAHADYFPGGGKPRLNVYTHSSIERYDESVANSLARTGKDETFEGVAALSQEGKTTSMTMHSGDRVLYFRWSDEWDRAVTGLFRSGKTYRIILRDEYVFDDDEFHAFVSDRDHKGYDDTVNDSKCYVLMRVEEGGAVIFDRSVCEVHHVKMSEITAKVRDGTSASHPGEAECQRKFPHYRDFLKIACIADGTERESHYVCPECVAACKRLTDPNR